MALPRNYTRDLKHCFKVRPTTHCAIETVTYITYIDLKKVVDLIIAVET